MLQQRSKALLVATAQFNWHAKDTGYYLKKLEYQMHLMYAPWP